MFDLAKDEWIDLRFQFGTSSWGGVKVYADGFYRKGCGNPVARVIENESRQIDFRKSTLNLRFYFTPVKT